MIKIEFPQTKVLFILGSPRVGSTILYQFIINHFNCFFPSNRLNQSFIDGTWQSNLASLVEIGDERVAYQSFYGKTIGDDQPSEASALFKYFFGGEHPSETHSKEPIIHRKDLFLGLLEKINGLVQKPMVFKNAWNCFRVASLARLFPDSSFLWIRRDVAAAAYSDLLSRINRGGPDVWNSATTANVWEIKKLPYWEQVVEQQYSYTERLSIDLNEVGKERVAEVWYEDLCQKTSETFECLKTFLASAGFSLKVPNSDLPKLKLSDSFNRMKESEDGKKILTYSSQKKFSHLRRLLENVEPF